jgi:hypothetical protein
MATAQGPEPTSSPGQLPIEHRWAKIGDAKMVDAMLDRLIQQHHCITPSGDSLRSKMPQAVQGSETIDVPTAASAAMGAT